MAQPIATREMTLQEFLNSPLVVVSEKQRQQLRDQYAGQLDNKVTVTATTKGK